LVVERNADETYTIKAQPKAKNGMRVNDKSVPQAVLANGDRVRIGETEILFLATDQASQVEAVKRIRVVWSPTPTVRPTKRRLSKTK
jgi:pSer/pThr/pTyr-binding forkhead associated (FHA) protein